MRIRIGIKIKLIFFILVLALGPLLIVGSMSIYSMNINFQNERMRSLDAIGHNKVEIVENWFGGRRSDALFISSLEELQDHFIAYVNNNTLTTEREYCETIFKNMSKIYGCYDEMMLVSSSGFLQIVTLSDDYRGYNYTSKIGTDISTEPFFSYCQLQGENSSYSFLSDFEMIEEVLNEFKWEKDEYGYYHWVMQIGTSIKITSASPLVNESASGADRFLGVVVLNINEDYLSEEIMQSTIGLGATGETYLINKDYLWLTSSKHADYWLAFPEYTFIQDTILDATCATSGVIQCLTTGQQVSLSSSADYRGISVMGVYYYLDINNMENPWVLVTQIDVSEAMFAPNILSNTLLILLIVIGIISACIAFLIARSFSNPIVRMTSQAKKIAEGDLRSKVIFKGRRKRKDEIGILGTSFNYMIAQLRQVINSSQNASVNVSNMATELSASASEVNASAEEISATTMEVTLNSQNQARSLEQINLMTQDVKNITNLITNLSEQTNLLALNASIEAGRAGEYGLGFAVVANKIQKLAEESRNSVEKTVSIVETISKMISGAAESSDEISRAMEGISTAAEEQTASMEEISATSSRLEDLSRELKENLSNIK